MDKDISAITDVNELKALAYDEISSINNLTRQIEAHQNNLQVVNSRILMVSQDKNSKSDSKK